MLNQLLVDKCQSLESRSTNAQSEEAGTSCSKNLDVAFFFDGIGKDISKDISNGSLSNTARLFQIFPDQDPENRYSKSYFSGLGASFDGGLFQGFGGAANRVPDEAASSLDGQLRGATKSAGKESLQTAGDKPWYEVFGRTWANSFTDWKGWLKEVRNGAIKAGAEIFAPIRDNEVVANVIMSGAPTRLSAALTRFENLIDEHQSRGGMTLRSVRVHVFGCDFGAAMAKRFVRELLEGKCKAEGDSYFYGEIEIVPSFVGLFDCVDRTHSEMGPLDWLHPLTPVLDDGGGLHQGVRRAFHLVAAHERRFYRRSRTLGSLRDGWSEILFPGISEDVTGGLSAENQKLSNELSTVALHRMYNRAFRAGVPLPHLEDLPAIDARLAKSFVFNDVIGNHSILGLARHYEKYSSSQLLPSEESFYYHAALRLAWQAFHYVQYRSTKDALEQSASETPGWAKEQALRMFELLTEGECTDWDQIAEKREKTESALALLEERWGWLADVEDEANHLIARYESPDSSVARHARLSLKKQCALAYHWRSWTRTEQQPQIPDQVFMLFSFGLHDKLPADSNYRIHQQTSLFHGYRFFAWRGLDEAIS